MKRMGVLVALIFGLVLCVPARADYITLNYDSFNSTVVNGVSQAGSTIDFNRSTGTFSFSPASNGFNFSVTSVAGISNGSGLGLSGNLLGTFQIGPITTVGAYESAPVTVAAGSVTPQLVISDGNGGTLTANLSFVEIYTVGGTGGINPDGAIVTLSDFQYSIPVSDTTPNADLVVLANSTSGDINTTFSFTPFNFDLKYLTTKPGGDGGAIVSTEFSGSLSGDPVATPAPASCVLMLTGGLLSGLGFLRRRIFRLA